MSRLLGNDDRVEVIYPESTESCSLLGLQGRVIADGTRGSEICVEFDINIRGHNGHGLGRHGYCWYIHKSQLVKIPDTRTFKQKIEDRCKYLYNH